MKLFHIRWREILTLLICCLGHAGIQAQTQRPLETRRADAARSQIVGAQPSGSAPADPDIGAPAPKMKGDAEFGEQLIVARRAQAEPWSFALDAQYFYTDNVALVPEGEVDDFFLRTGIYAQYANRIVGDWFVDAALSNYVFLHDEHDFFDFHLLRAEAGVTRRLPKLADAFASVHYSWYRISDSDFGDSAFQDHTINAYLQKIWKVSRGQQIIAGTGADFSLAPEPSEPGRNEGSAFVGYKLRLTESFSVQAGYRGAYYQYPDIDRHDWNHSVTVGCTYEITDWARAMITATGSLNRSDNPFFDYNNVVSGVGISLHIEF